MVCPWLTTSLSRNWVVHALILFSVIMGFNLGCSVENRNLGTFVRLGQACRTYQLLSLLPHITLNLMLNMMKHSITFGEKPDVAKYIWRLAEILLVLILFAPLFHLCNAPRKPWKWLCTSPTGWAKWCCIWTSMFLFEFFQTFFWSFAHMDRSKVERRDIPPWQIRDEIFMKDKKATNP